MGTATTSRTETLLSIEDVCLKYGSKEVLSNVTARIDNLLRSSGETTGQVVAFLGPSGCGKTSLLRILAGLQKPTSGKVYIGAERRPAQPGLVGMVMQNYILYHNRTVLGNLMIAARQSYSTEESRVRVRNIMQQLGLEQFRDYYPAQLSGGQRQRVAIAQQVLCQR